jgi:hypothetical protein
MFNLQEIMDKTAANRKLIEEEMDRTHGGFYPYDQSIYTGLNDADKAGIHETLTKVPLAYWLAAGAVNQGLKDSSVLKEYVMHSGALTTGTIGAQGFNYLLPDIIYTALFENASQDDIAPLISNMLECPGAELKVDAEADDKFKPGFTSSGGEAPYKAITTAQGTIKPKTFTMNIGVTNDMIEDNLFNVMASHISIAGKRMGEFSSRMALFPVMDDHRATATTYRIEGAYNAFNTGGASTFDWTDLMEGWANNNVDGWKSDVAVLPPMAPQTLLTGAAGYPTPLAEWSKINLNQNPVTNLNGIDVVVCSHMTTTDTPAELSWQAGLYSTHWNALILNKTYGIQTVRKRWLKLENYSDPIKDLVGAVVSARQGHIVAYADACCVASYA